MPLPRVAIVGRPNAGKSSLMNMIAGAKVSIVDPTPGVTRDRVTAIVDLAAPDNRGPRKPVEFVDTGGFGVYVKEGGRFDEVGADLAKLTDSIEFQIQQAVEGSDLILFAVDVQQGVTPHDMEIARLLRERRLGAAGPIDASRRNAKPLNKQPAARADAPGTRKKNLTTDDHGTLRHSAAPPARSIPTVRVVATKVDGPKWESHAAELASLGFGEPLMCSAKSNYFRRDFLETVYELLPDPSKEDARGARSDLMLAIVGKRNAGKSTLVNHLAGEPRMIVSEIAGTTRDAVDVRFEFEGRSLTVIDTAGLRRKRSFQSMIDTYALDRLQRAVDRADAVILLIDATAPISQVDEHLAQMARQTYKPVIIVVNKWDLVAGTKDEKNKPVTPARYEEYIRRELRGLPFAPISFVSGATGENIRATIRLAFELKAQSEERVTTGKLNRLVRAILERQGPTDTKGTHAKVYYVAQTGIAPPTITLVVNHPQLFTANYLRFLMNRFREELPYPEVPIRIVIRARRQREDDLVHARDGVEDAAIRIARGRKGADVRARRRAAEVAGGSTGFVAGDGEFCEEILGDDQSVLFDTGSETDSATEADEYFDED